MKVNTELLQKKIKASGLKMCFIAEKLGRSRQALSDKIPEIAGIRASTTYKQPVCQKLCLRILNDLLGGDQQ